MRTDRAMFAAGCFWGVEATFRKLDGVVSTRVGFAGGHLDHPTYKDLCSGKSGHAETVAVEFDPTKISYAELLDTFWSCHDPTELNITGAAEGEPERSIIFVHDAEQQRLANASRDEVNASRVFREKIRTEILAAAQFYPAEEDHQQYLAKQGSETSCHVGEIEVRTKLATTARDALRRGN
ncbi:MAG: peptide-methionine (S)-S-oxide reductase MsrA [Anaerolineae bacterium]|nr:peptide-methionine (S)-S-oxide reductase MsrA [Phycisphaerae bacterium]